MSRSVEDAESALKAGQIVHLHGSDGLNEDVLQHYLVLGCSVVLDQTQINVIDAAIWANLRSELLAFAGTMYLDGTKRVYGKNTHVAMNNKNTATPELVFIASMLALRSFALHPVMEDTKGRDAAPPLYRSGGLQAVITQRSKYGFYVQDKPSKWSGASDDVRNAVLHAACGDLLIRSFCLSQASVGSAASPGSYFAGKFSGDRTSARYKASFDTSLQSLTGFIYGTPLALSSFIVDPSRRTVAMPVWTPELLVHGFLLRTDEEIKATKLVDVVDLSTGTVPAPKPEVPDVRPPDVDPSPGPMDEDESDKPAASHSDDVGRYDFGEDLTSDLKNDVADMLRTDVLKSS